MHHVTKLISSQTGLFNITMRSLDSNGLQSPDLSPTEHLWDVLEREIGIIDVQPTHLQQLRDAVMSIWTQTSEECFQHLVESLSRRSSEDKRGSNLLLAGVPDKVNKGRCLIASIEICCQRS